MFSDSSSRHEPCCTVLYMHCTVRSCVVESISTDELLVSSREVMMVCTRHTAAADVRYLLMGPMLWRWKCGDLQIALIWDSMEGQGSNWVPRLHAEWLGVMALSRSLNSLVLYMTNSEARYHLFGRTARNSIFAPFSWSFLAAIHGLTSAIPASSVAMALPNASLVWCNRKCVSVGHLHAHGNTGHASWECHQSGLCTW